MMLLRRNKSRPCPVPPLASIQKASLRQFDGIEPNSQSLCGPRLWARNKNPCKRVCPVRPSIAVLGDGRSEGNSGCDY